jgi:hypothetical protein
MVRGDLRVHEQILRERERIMSEAVAIVFECLPFRLVGHAGLPLDASDEQQALWRRFRAALHKHGTANTYFLYNADCTFHLANDSGSYLRFVWEATVRTNDADERPAEIDLACRLAETDFAQPLGPPVLEFFREALRRAVLAEFQRFIDAGNLKRALAQREHILQEWDHTRGFVGMDI